MPTLAMQELAPAEAGELWWSLLDRQAVALLAVAEASYFRGSGGLADRVTPQRVASVLVAANLAGRPQRRAYDSGNRAAKRARQGAVNTLASLKRLGLVDNVGPDSDLLAGGYWWLTIRGGTLLDGLAVA